jgi:hypothetical protein
MYEVYFSNYEGRDDEPEAVFESLELAEEYMEADHNNLAYDEYYMVHDVEKDLWW